MEKYKYHLKEPIYVEFKGEIKRIRLMEFSNPPEYYIADGIVYIRCQGMNMYGNKIGIPFYLPIILSEEEFLETIGQNVEELPGI